MVDWLELSNKLTAMILGQTGNNLSASAKPFVPLTTSSATAARQPWGGSLPPLDRDMEPTRPSTPLTIRELPPMCLPQRHCLIREAAMVAGGIGRVSKVTLV